MIRNPLDPFTTFAFRPSCPVNSVEFYSLKEKSTRRDANRRFQNRIPVLSAIEHTAAIEFLSRGDLVLRFPSSLTYSIRNQGRDIARVNEAISRPYQRKDTKHGDCFGRFRSLAISAIYVTVFMRMCAKAKDRGQGSGPTTRPTGTPLKLAAANGSRRRGILGAIPVADEICAGRLCRGRERRSPNKSRRDRA